MNPRLNAVSGALAGQGFVLGAEPLTIGRDRTSSLHLRDLAVSRHHCVIETSEGRLLLRDLGSSHGTFVNGMPVTERTLEHGDLVTVGGSLFLVQTREEEQRRESESVLLDDRDRPWVAESTVHLALPAPRPRSRCCPRTPGLPATSRLC